MHVRDQRLVRAQCIEFRAAVRSGAPRGDGTAGIDHVYQVVPIAVERQTGDVTLKMVVAFKPHMLVPAAQLAAPSGLPYTVHHRRRDADFHLSEVQVYKAETDQCGMAILRRKGTLYVGETYVVRTASVAGMAAGEAEFTVREGSEYRPQSVVIELERAHRDLKFTLCPALTASHWAARLPLPDRIAFEVRHTESGELLHRGHCPADVA